DSGWQSFDMPSHSVRSTHIAPERGQAPSPGGQRLTGPIWLAFNLRLMLGVKPRLMSLGIHVGVIALLILISSHPAIRPAARDAIDLARSRVARTVAPKPYRGPGGGGQKDLPPASRGRLPKVA